MRLCEAQRALRNEADEDIARHSRRFFKCGSGEYGEGDCFLGVRVPVIRQVAKVHQATPLPIILKVLQSRWHEERLLALILMVQQFAKADESVRTEVYDAYLAHTGFINNWDLVDSSAHQIVGGHLLNKQRTVLQSLAASDSLWERRISIIATYHFIKRDQFDDTLRLARLLLNDPEDLIHKAVGWMLREVGKRDRAREDAFLSRYSERMPRTMLRYAIEKHTPEERTLYMRHDRRERQR